MPSDSASLNASFSILIVLKQAGCRQGTGTPRADKGSREASSSVTMNARFLSALSDAALDVVLYAVHVCLAWMVTGSVLRVPDDLLGGRPIE